MVGKPVVDPADWRTVAFPGEEAGQNTGGGYKRIRRVSRWISEAAGR